MEFEFFSSGMTHDQTQYSSQNGTGVQIWSWLSPDQALFGKCMLSCRLSEFEPTYITRLFLMDDRVCSWLLSVTAFSTVVQCTQWIVSHMAQNYRGESQLRKPRVWWSDEEEIGFINYLLKHQLEATWGCFKGGTIAAAIQSVASLQVRGQIKQ